MFLEDKRAGFDSMKYEHINLFLSCIGVPPKIIKTYMHLLAYRQSQVVTAYGPSKKFRPQRGAPEGGVESPLIWLTCYDICLARLRKENSPFSSSIYPMLHSPTLSALMS
jgi:hypothetical protein